MRVCIKIYDLQKHRLKIVFETSLENNRPVFDKVFKLCNNVSMSHYKL